MYLFRRPLSLLIGMIAVIRCSLQTNIVYLIIRLILTLLVDYLLMMHIFYLKA